MATLTTKSTAIRPTKKGPCKRRGFFLTCATRSTCEIANQLIQRSNKLTTLLRRKEGAVYARYFKIQSLPILSIPFTPSQSVTLEE